MRQSFPFIPHDPEGQATAVTPYPVIWLIENDLEGNYSGVNHVLEKFPEATSYHRFVVSEPHSLHITTCKETRSWTAPKRGNEFKKYPYPISVEHLEETVIYPVYEENRVMETVMTHLTVIPPNIQYVEFM